MSPQEEYLLITDAPALESWLPAHACCSQQTTNGLMGCYGMNEKHCSLEMGYSVRVSKEKTCCCLWKAAYQQTL